MTGTTGATSEEEIITGPKPGEDSLAKDLDNRREVTADMILGGHPNDVVEEGASTGEEEGAPVLEAKPEEKAEEKKGEELPKKEEPPAGPRFKSQEEAEKAHDEAVKKMTVATMEAAENKKTLEKLQSEIEDLRKAQGKPPETKEEKPVVKPPTDEERMATILEASRTAMLAAVPKIRALDPEDPDYEQKYSDIMAGVNVATVKALLDSGISTKSLTREEVESIYQEKLEATRQESEKKDLARVEERALELGISSGLNLKDPESLDAILWERYKNKIPQEVYGKNSLEAQVEWVANKVREMTGKVALSGAEKEAEARKFQEEQKPLGRGGERPKPKPKQETEGSLKDDFDDARRARVL